MDQKKRTCTAFAGAKRRSTEIERRAHEPANDDTTFGRRVRVRVAGLAAAVRGAVADSPWTPAVAKVLLGASVFVALALVGSGAALGWLPDPQPRAARAAIAAAGASATASAGSSASAVASSAPPPSQDAGAPSDGAAGSGVTPDGKIVLNLANEDELRRLPGIGPGRARAILALRARLGHLKRPEDLLRVKGIGRKLLARIRPLVLVDPPATAQPAPKAGG